MVNDMTSPLTDIAPVRRLELDFSPLPDGRHNSSRLIPIVFSLPRNPFLNVRFWLVRRLVIDASGTGESSLVDVKIKMLGAEEQSATGLSAIWLTAANVSQPPVYQLVALRAVADRRHPVTDVPFPVEIVTP